MNRQRQPLRSTLGRSTSDSVVVRGHDLTGALMGHVSFGDMAFLQITGRVPDESESVLVNAMLVALVEHGMTPSALAARLTWAGAPESLQAAVAAGLCGVGSRFAGTMEGSARMLSTALADLSEETDLSTIAREVVATHSAEQRHLPGLGHPVHRPTDPRAERLRELARKHGREGRHLRLMWIISEQASAASGKTLPVNVTGAIGALVCELGLDPRMARGIAVMSRAVGLVGHLCEEIEHPMADELYRRVEEEVSST
jgi:citrate synthase